MNANLPPGWRCVNAPDGRPYYFNEQTRETSWTPPAAPPPSASQSSLNSSSAIPPSFIPQHSSPSAYPAHGPAAPPAHSSSALDHRPGHNGVEHLAQHTANLSLAPHAQAQPISYPHGKYTLQSLISKTTLQQAGTEFFEQERDKLLQINLGVGGNNFAWIKNGTMIARKGDVKFTTQGLKDQGFGKYMKKKLTGEGMKLVKCEGVGKVFVADDAKQISVVQLQEESLSLNGNDVLAFSGSLKYDIKLMKSAGILAGGLFNVKIWGTGMLAFTCHGSVVTMYASEHDPVFTDPDATVAWTHDPKMTTDVSMKAMIGKTTGEEVQLKFTQGIVVVQPFEEVDPVASGGGGGGGNAVGGLVNGVLGAM